MPIKRDTKKTPFCMSFNRVFSKDDLQDNNCVGHSLIKPVDAVASHKIKAIREVNNYESNNFETVILDECALDKALKVPENTLDAGKPLKTIYEVIYDGYFKQSDVDFPKDFLLK